MSKIYVPSAIKRRNATLGSETLIYFERLSDGHLIIPPIANAPTPRDHVRMEADSASKLEAVSRRFEAQKKREFASIDEAQCARIEAKHKEIRGRLISRMAVTRSQFEKEFIRLALVRLEKGEENIRPRRIEGHLSIEAG